MNEITVEFPQNEGIEAWITGVEVTPKIVSVTDHRELTGRDASNQHPIMFSLSEFVKNGFIKAVGKMADYQIILNAAGWLEKRVLTEADLADIQTAIDAQYVVPDDSAELPDDLEGAVES